MGGKAYDEALDKEEKKEKNATQSSMNSGEEKVEVYVPSKLDKVASASASDDKTENAMATSIELAEKTEDSQEELIKKDAGHEHNETVLVKEDEDEDDAEKEDYVQVDKENEEAY